MRALQTAREIEAEVIQRGWPLGEALGSEAYFIERCRTGRAVGQRIPEWTHPGGSGEFVVMRVRSLVTRGRASTGP